MTKLVIQCSEIANGSLQIILEVMPGGTPREEFAAKMVKIAIEENGDFLQVALGAKAHTLEYHENKPSEN